MTQTNREGPPGGRVAAIDFGTKRIGIAISDAGRILASPYENYRRQTIDRDSHRFRQLVEEECVTLFVVGLPLHMSGDESQKSIEARAFGRWLQETTGIPVDFFDERFSSKEADSLLEASGASSKKRRSRRDMMAAQVILSSYLEANRA